MKISQSIKKLEHTYTVKMDDKDLSEVKEKIIDELAAKVSLPGFRAGKAPKNIVIQRYKNEIESDVLEQSVKKSLKDIYEKHEIRPVAYPTVNLVKQDEQELEFTLSFEVFPEIKHIDFEKIKLEKSILKLEEKDTEESLQRLSEYYQDFTEVTRETKEKDKITIDFEGKKDGVAFAGGAAKGFDIVLGSKTFIPGFEEQLIGKNVGDNFDVNVSFPEAYHVKELAGQPVVFHVTIHKVLEPKPHEINDELAKKTGNDSIEKLKETIASSYQEQMDKAQYGILRKNLLDEISKKYTFELPEKMLEKELDSTWKNYEAYRKHMEEHKQGMHQDHNHQNEKDPYEGKKDDEIKKLQKVEVENKLRLYMVFQDIANKEKITVSEEDVNRAILDRASSFRGQEEMVFQYYTKNPEAKEELRATLLEQSVIKSMLDKVTYKTTETTIDEFAKNMEKQKDA